MQVFLPYESILETVKCLDSKRLFKQVLECDDIINNHWKHHPISKMYTKYIPWLKNYRDMCLFESKANRKYATKLELYSNIDFNNFQAAPLWLGNKEFHARHRVALLTKNYEYYKQFNWQEKPDKNYKYLYYNNLTGEFYETKNKKQKA